VRKHHREAGSGKALARRYDAVIVGAGSADCVVARHLVDGADATVPLLHAGGSVMPTIPSASTNAFSIMIDECASRLHERCARRFHRDRHTEARLRLSVDPVLFVFRVDAKDWLADLLNCVRFLQVPLPPFPWNSLCPSLW
jgi:hypothetical protein